jgi:hypothetical protein
MRSSAPNLVLAAIAALSLFAITVWIHDAVAAQRHEKMSEDFQSLVGGLGFGPALDLSNGTHSFDPRLDGEGADVDENLPGATRSGADNPLSIFRYPRLRRSCGPSGAEE